MAMELPVRPADTRMQHLSIQGVFRPGGTLPMAICQPEAAMRMATGTTLSSPLSSRNRAVSSRCFRKNHTNHSETSSGANIYFDNAAFIADNSFCEITHSSTAHIMPSVAEIRNHGFRPRGASMAICRPEAAIRMATGTTLSSPLSSHNRAVPSRRFRKNHTNHSKASSGANIYFDNAAFIADNSFCKITHSSTTEIKPSVAEIRNHGKQVWKTVFAETFFFSPMQHLATAHRAEVPLETGLLRAPQMAGRGFARAVTGWVWRREIPAPPGK
jgi:hypothetical protein